MMVFAVLFLLVLPRMTFAQAIIIAPSGGGQGSPAVPIVLDLGNNGSNESVSLSKIATTGDTNAVFGEPSNDVLLVDLTKRWPSSDTAVALSANGTNCGAGQAAAGVDASGNAEGCAAIGGAGHTIQDESSSLTARTKLNFLGAGVGCVDNSGADSTDCTITGAASNPAGSTTQLQYNNAGSFGGTTGLVYGDPATLATSGWKFGSNGLSAAFTNPDAGGDINFRRAIDISLTVDGSNQNTNFSTNTLFSLGRVANGPGQNDYDGVAKTTYSVMNLASTDRAQGQHFLTLNTMYGYAMGDYYSSDHTLYVFGGTNASGDEGQGLLRLQLTQQAPITKATLNTIPSQTTCNTTLTQSVTKNVTPQAVTVASTTGCAVNDRVVIDAGDMVGSKPRMEIVKITAVNAGVSITAQFRESHNSGVTVSPTVLLALSSSSNLGAGRYLVNYTSSAYTTGTVASISGTGFVGSGTSWASNMVGGTALIPGCIALTADDYSGDPFSGANGPLKGWHGIASVTDSTHLNIAHFKEAAHPASYVGNGVGSDATYTIRACARVLELSSNNVWLEPNSFAWTAGDTVVLAHSVDLSVTSLVRAQVAVYNPNAEVTALYAGANYGAKTVAAALHFISINTGTPNFGNILESSAHTSGAAIFIQGTSDDGESMRLNTANGDNKRIRWSTNQSPVFIGGDWATGNLDVVMQSAPDAFMDVHDENDVGADIRFRQWRARSLAFAALGTPSNGTMVYCSDCTIANPCAGSGTGALAKRLNSTWVCN